MKNLLREQPAPDHRYVDTASGRRRLARLLSIACANDAPDERQATLILLHYARQRRAVPLD